MTLWGRKLIIEALGPRGADESVKAYLRRGSAETDIGLPSLVKMWKGLYESKNSISKLQRRKASNNADKLAFAIEIVETAARDSEMADRPREETDVLRAAARILRDENIPAGPADRAES